MINGMIFHPALDKCVALCYSKGESRKIRCGKQRVFLFHSVHLHWYSPQAKFPLYALAPIRYNERVGWRRRPVSTGCQRNVNGMIPPADENNRRCIPPQEQQLGGIIMRNARTLKLVQLSLLAAIVVLFAFVPGLGYLPLGIIRPTTLHIPVIIGAILLGPKEGAILGAVFGLTSFINSTFFPTSPTAFIFSPFYRVGEIGGNFWSLVICFVPRILVGVFPYYVYTWISRRVASKKGETLALALAGFTGSMTNTLLVMHMIYLFFGASFAAVQNVAQDTLYALILTVIGTNGVPEAIVAMILVTAIVRGVQASMRRWSGSKGKT